mmetsp:Transcript_13039/g.40168  ORF Transcript_13039/g.40168 Transcript_13039/m.40168 type:complete len:214 (+) Transcript_13039:696-1337(+)
MTACSKLWTMDTPTTRTTAGGSGSGGRAKEETASLEIRKSAVTLSMMSPIIPEAIRSAAIRTSEAPSVDESESALSTRRRQRTPRAEDTASLQRRRQTNRWESTTGSCGFRSRHRRRSSSSRGRRMSTKSSLMRCGDLARATGKRLQRPWARGRQISAKVTHKSSFFARRYPRTSEKRRASTTHPTIWPEPTLTTRLACTGSPNWHRTQAETG